MTDYTKTIKPSKKKAVNFTDDGEPCRRFKWIVEIEVDETWVLDGFDLTQDRLKGMLESELPFSTSLETDCKIIKTPDPKLIREAQGYTV